MDDNAYLKMFALARMPTPILPEMLGIYPSVSLSTPSEVSSALTASLYRFPLATSASVTSDATVDSESAVCEDSDDFTVWKELELDGSIAATATAELARQDEERRKVQAAIPLMSAKNAAFWKRTWLCLFALVLIVLRAVCIARVHMYRL